MRDELIQRRGELHAEATALLDTANAENRGLTAEERTHDDEIAAEIDALDDRIMRSDRLSTRNGRLDAERTAAVRAAAATATPPDGRVVRAVRPTETFGFNDIAEFAVAVREASRPNGTVDERLSRINAAPTNFMQEVGTAEGQMVPPAFSAEIWSLVFNGDDILGRMSPEPTSSNSVELLADETTPWGSAGVIAKWRGEGEQMQPSKLATKRRFVPLHELYAFVLATDELLRDAPRLADRITRQAARAIQWKASEAIVAGDGAGQPLGYTKSDALVVVAKEAGQLANTVNATNVAKLYARLWPVNYSGAFWLINSDVFPQLMTMSIANEPIWLPPNGFMPSPGGVLLGRPVMISEHAEALSSQGDIQLIDPMGYYAANHQEGMQFASSMHLYFDYGLQAFRWTFRFGGEPYLSAPVAPAKGAATKSHFVTLAAR